MMLAEVVCVSRRSPSRAFRTAAYATSTLANNIPDIDPIYTWITVPRPLGSLLHHRGHTHTLPVAWLLGALHAAAVIALVERRHGALSALERGWIGALAVVGATLHITMDFGNNYGVHPFWPVSSRWFYGDSIFIIEPIWLAIALPAMAFVLGRGPLAWLLWALLAALFALAIMLPFVSRGTVIAMVVVSLASASVSRFASARARIAAAWAGWIAVAAGFAIASARTRAVLHEVAAGDFPELRVLDLAITPMPGNPLCWSALVLGEQGSDYRVLNASVAPLPSWADVASCPYDADAAPTAQVVRVTAHDHPRLRWRWSYTSPLAALRELARRDCRFRALLGFARVPYVSEVVLPGGAAAERVAGDLRYDRGPGLDFADLQLSQPSGACPNWIPPWIPARADVFRLE